jgi:hypothetical protein
MRYFQEIWFDMDGTLAFQDAQWNAAHDNVRYQVYADFVGATVTESLRQE